MSKVTTFSRAYPSYHPRAGDPTNFVEKIWESLIQLEEISISRCCELSRETGIGNYTMNSMGKMNFQPKFHTIRAGHRFKAGDWFSPRVWSGKPYRSKQITIAPDIQIKKVWDFVLHGNDFIIDGIPLHKKPWELIKAFYVNDGFIALNDFVKWFANVKSFDGQVICWNENINY